MKINKIVGGLILFAGILFMNSCEDFLEVETPNYMLDSKAVFTKEETAQTALQGMFNQLFNTSFANGGSQSVSFLGGLSADTYSLTTTTQDLVEFHQNQLSPGNSSNFTLWAGAYNIIYQANALLNGVEGNNSLNEEIISEIEGSAKFVRAFTYFYLENLYGEVPLILDTNYEENSLASRTSIEVIRSQILNDLEDSALLLNEDYPGNDRTRVNRFAVFALLAKVHLYSGNWQEAESYSTRVIEASSHYELLENPNEVFLAHSREAIWQISPIGWGNNFTHTRDGNLLTKTPTSYNLVTLSESLVDEFSKENDARYEGWINPFPAESDTLYYPNKYKIQYDVSGGPILEYSMVLRLAEQYLIRAEARARMENLSGTIEDLNKIKSRAGIVTIESTENITAMELLEEILLERRRELFSEWGHRWFDLQRFDKTEILEDKDNSQWTVSANLFPIPSEERMKNTNLTQNPGY